MMDDLQQAYSAYQQALYHLRDPKVRDADTVPVNSFIAKTHRNPNYGTASGYSMIVTDPLSMPRRPSPKSCACSLILKKPTRSISVWA